MHKMMTMMMMMMTMMMMMMIMMMSITFKAACNIYLKNSNLSIRVLVDDDSYFPYQIFVSIVGHMMYSRNI